MLKMVSCSEIAFNRITRFAKSNGDFSQETFRILGITVAYRQPNMIGEYWEPDFYWCLFPFNKILG